MTKQRQLNIQQTPLPLETAFFQENVATNTITQNGETYKQKIEDPVHWNRYYFDYPPEWITSDIGENIVGVRSLWLLNKQRHIEFTLYIRKYAKYHFLAAYNARYNTHLTQDELDLRYVSDTVVDSIVTNRINNEHISVCSIPVDIIIKHDEDFHKIGEYIESHLAEFIPQMNAENSGWVFNLNPHFVQEPMSAKYGSRNRDIAFDEVYSDFDEKTFKVVFSSPRNKNQYSENQDNDDLDCYVDIAIMKSDATLNKLYDEKYKKKDPFYQQWFDEFDFFNDDTTELFNINNFFPLQWQNSLDYLASFHRKIEFKNLWDRHTCKVHASFANPSNHYYVGNSHVHFTPIKYYKLSSTDKRFWIEFYSARNPDIPVRLPDCEGFVLEMQFMQNDKLLYV